MHILQFNQVPKCYKETQDESGEWGNWQGVSLKEFMACETNLAVNRQTRMLADLDLVDCYNTSTMSLAKREAIMVASAKTNLERMAYFGLTEEQRRPFVDQSNWLRMQHARNFPDYKYQPKRRKPKKKKTKFSTASEAPPPT